MRIYRDECDQGLYLEFNLPGKNRSGSLAHFTNDWTQLFRREQYNWRTFNFIKLYVEDDKMLGAVEIEAALLGLGFRVRLGLTVTEELEELQQRVKDIESGKVETISMEDVIKRLEGKDETNL